METVEFEYQRGEKVNIIAIDTEGRVNASMITSYGKQFSVIYWSDGTRKDVWMQDWEIESTKEIT